MDAGLTLARRPDLADPQAVARLRLALLAGERSGRLLLTCQQAEAWLCAPDAEALADARGADPALAAEALALLRGAALVAMGLAPGPDWPQRAAAFDARPHTADEAAAVGRYMRAGALATELGFATGGIAPAADEVALRAEMDRLSARQTVLQAHTTPGDLQPAALDGLDALIAEFLGLRAAARADNPVLPYLCFFAASACYALGRGRTLAGQLRAASAAYAQAATLYGVADEPDQADAAREEAERTRFAADADIDGASLADLRRVADGVAEPMERARTLMRLSDRAAEANDGFAALAHAEAALAALRAAGLPEPEPECFPAAIGSWIATACDRAAGSGAVRLLIWAGTAMLKTQALRWRVRPGLRTPQSQAGFDRLSELLRMLPAESASVQAELRAGLAEYGVAPPADVAPPASNTALATALLRRVGDVSEVADAEGLVAEARAIGMPALVAQACAMLATLRLDAGDGPGCIVAALEGEAALLPDGAAAETLLGLPGFDILVELRRQRLGAYAGAGDNAAVFACAWATVALIEAARYRISDPFQQASFLAQRTAFYELATYSAYKLERWDELLTVMDLFKARSAVRNRLAPALDTGAEVLAARLREATDALAGASEEQRPALAAHRHALWDLLTVTRLSQARAGDLPELSVAAVQAALAPEEAAVSWSWVSASVLVVLAIRPLGLHAEHVVMSDAQQAVLKAFLNAMAAGQLKVRALGSTVAKIGEAVLPPATRAFIASATRLVFSPHRQLNLVPLHAARFDGAFLIERASVRTVPNLASLILPWHGAGTGLAAIGLDQTDLPEWPRLAFAESEARSVADAWAARGEPVTRLLGAEATVAGVAKLDLGSRRCIHIATHGSSVFLGDARADPFASFVVLKDGKLDALGLSQLRLRADTVVVSACFSGQRALSLRGLDELPGDDMFGLQAALFQAGARNVVGTLWPFVDASAGRMLPVLHAGLAAGIAPDLALQAAVRGELALAPAGDIYGWAPLFLSSMGRAVQTPVE